MTILSANIRRLRIKLGFTQKELANEFRNISSSAVTLWENGYSKPSIENLIALSEIFGVSVNDIIYKKTVVPVNYQSTKFKHRLINAWIEIEATEQMRNKFNSWDIAERVEFLLTIDAVLCISSKDSRDIALHRILAGEGNENTTSKSTKKKAVRIVKKPNSAKRKKKAG